MSRLPLEAETRYPFEEISQGLQARQLWENVFAEYKEILPGEIKYLYTGIGEAPAENEVISVNKMGDTSKIARYIDLKAEFSTIPKILFLIASPLLSDDVINLRSVARHYKEQGVDKVVAVMTTLAHERQDHTFNDDQGNPILEATILKEIVGTLSGFDLVDKKTNYYRRPIDAALLIQPHSLRPVEFGLREDFPILPLDAMDFLIDRANLVSIANPFVLGPDKGRRDEARRIASVLQCEQESLSKKRDRLNGGRPSIYFSPQLLQRLKEGDYTVICADDEIREGGTYGEITNGLKDIPIVICAVKMIAAQRDGVTAIDHLNKPNVRKIFITDAVKPQNDLAPLADRMEVIPIGLELEKIIDYLKNKLSDPGNPDWLDPSETGTLIHLDLTPEIYA
ncbi:hypothetical protein A2W14_02465 [Candidatus Gottesmanbacteria bacterium RBG_16_37_8]|uniref:Phosphoribosyl pyrophosphate synthase n=1 Tax=Candidatus Gottesmanbacteria bacterium RBG_16_37_8 TaxID=1798371 RepID=A0A1F5YPI3_9BACT|nr:MAG: hypothetical protein A2W14_02465 [Candidatus Gottesmanbacteria bacterium RBG_16_37_8]